jgi:hypothetical protein
MRKAAASRWCSHLPTPRPPVSPDPESGSFEDTQPLQVGSYEARAGTWNSVPKPSGAITAINQALYVEIPLGGGQQQDLVVGASGLSQTALISIVANGLSAGSPSTAGRTSQGV